MWSIAYKIEPLTFHENNKIIAFNIDNYVVTCKEHIKQNNKISITLMWDLSIIDWQQSRSPSNEFTSLIHYIKFI